MQKQWFLKTPDKAMVYGVTDFAGEARADKLFVICHGLTGHMDEQQHHAAPAYFNPLGYDVLRFNFYDSMPNARRLDECSISTHAADLKAVLREHATGYKNVFIAGHSFGGLTVALANPDQATAVSLWDPSFDTEGLFSPGRCPVRKVEDGYLLQWGVQSLIGQGMYDEVCSFTHAACVAMVENDNCPLQVVWAGEDALAQMGDSFHNYAPEPSELAVIDGAMHCFHEPGAREALYDATHKWFDRFAA